MTNKNSEKIDILNSFASYLHEMGRSENTVKTYIGVLQSFLDWLYSNGKSSRDLNKENIQAYVTYLETEQRSLATIKKVFNTINTFAKSINRIEITQDINITQQNNINQVFPEYLSKVEIEELLQKIEIDSNKRNTAIVYTLLKTGIRVSELCYLNKEDISINNKNQTGQMVVRNKRDNNERTIPLPKSLVYHLIEYLKSRDDKEEALFLSNYQKRISVRTVQHMLQHYGVHPHKLRHTFCYELLQNGLDISIVAQLAGHSDINITKQYLKCIEIKQIDEDGPKYA
ncbi:tyrosine-type recombinase/integrase [Anaerobacillus alkalilacustris]|nr:tyrosine-type recombinase/integrase [Anaerobacillus alkalilacustris]